MYYSMISAVSMAKWGGAPNTVPFQFANYHSIWWKPHGLHRSNAHFHFHFTGGDIMVMNYHGSSGYLMFFLRRVTTAPSFLLHKHEINHNHYNYIQYNDKETPSRHHVVKLWAWYVKAGKDCSGGVIGPLTWPSWDVTRLVNTQLRGFKQTWVATGVLLDSACATLKHCETWSIKLKNTFE